MASVGPGGTGRGAASGGPLQACLRHRIPAGRRALGHRVSHRDVIVKMNLMSFHH